MKLRTTMLTSAFATLVAVASCSDDSAKKVRPAAGDGEAGEAGAPAERGGTGATSGSGGMGASGGVDAGPGGSAGATGGADAADAAGAAGAAGAAPTPTAPLFLFTVGPLSTGLPGSGVATTRNPQSAIFASSTANRDPVTGTNELRITAGQLGLADTDTLDAFAALQPTPSHALYWFSVSEGVEGAEGERPTRLAYSSADQEALGDVYFSDATLSFRNLGEGGDALGYNGLVADEQSLGLSPAAPATDGHLDDLTGVQILADGKLPNELYFSVDAGSGGLRNTAVAATDATERGCTIFKSALDGQNTVAFSCADLGLAPNSDVKALVVYGASAPSEALFAIARGSTGLTGTAVESAANPTSTVFASPLDGTNSLRADATAFGLSIDDHLDALAVVDRAPPSATYASTCHLTPAPDTAEGAGFVNLQTAHGLGTGLILVAGPTTLTATAPDAIAAYDVKTCAFVARSSIANGALQSRLWAPVPLVGWSVAAPFTKLEYWTLIPNGSGVQRLDATGAVLATYSFVGITPDTLNPLSLEYDPVHDQFYGVVVPPTGYDQRLTFPRPAAATPTGTALAVAQTLIPHPCAGEPEFSGVDAKGNSIYAQLDRNSGNVCRVCALDAAYGEFSNLPFSWSLETQVPDFAVLAPEVAFYGLFASSFVIERYTLTP